MPLPYLRIMPWTSWSREERLFCAVLYEHARRAPAEFASWLIDNAGLDISTSGDWELGYEVCLYRDYLWHGRGPTAAKGRFPRKRTFDLCLFGESAIIVIEAKVCEGFGSKQNESFKNDSKHIANLDGMQHLQVRLVALASSRYLNRCSKATREAFDRWVTWAQVAQKYSDPLLLQADAMYGRKRGELLVDPPAPVAAA